MHAASLSNPRQEDGGLLMVDQARQEETEDGDGQGGDKKMPDPTRLGATERERTRMHMLNDAFDDLRKVGSKHL